jgi:hypothetical protein
LQKFFQAPHSIILSADGNSFIAAGKFALELRSIEQWLFSRE